MLVVSRREGQVIRIGDHIKITVSKVKGSQVRIGVDAPRELPILREEVWESIQNQTKESERGKVQEEGGEEVKG